MCGAVAAFYNNGGIRTSLTVAKGETERVITAGDNYQINPFCNYWYIYRLTGAELAQQLVNGFTNMGNYGDQMSGLTFTYTQTEKESYSEETAAPDVGKGSPGGSRKSYDYTILLITLSDGTVVDPTDTETTYLVCTSNYSGTLKGGVIREQGTRLSDVRGSD